MPPHDAPRARESFVADLHPAYFSMVMATGIVSLAAQLRGLAWIAQPLLWLNVLFYCGLWMLTLLRLLMRKAEASRWAKLGFGSGSSAWLGLPAPASTG